jgi:hypothetical protein
VILHENEQCLDIDTAMFQKAQEISHDGGPVEFNAIEWFGTDHDKDCSFHSQNPLTRSGDMPGLSIGSGGDSECGKAACNFFEIDLLRWMRRPISASQAL